MYGMVLGMTLEQAIIVAIAMADEISYSGAKAFWERIQSHKDLPHEGDCLKQAAPCRPCCYKMMVADGKRLLELMKSVA